MATHLSARLAWHDRGWDGCVCDAPHLNAHCIVHKHIRDSRDDEKERKNAGTPFAKLKGWLPPCSRDPATYSDQSYKIAHNDPLERDFLGATKEAIPPYSCCPSPYRWMREENFQEVCDAESLTIRGPDRPRERGWVSEPDRQRELLRHFWAKIEPGASLVFYYCNQGNPLDETTPRIIVGVGRIAKVGRQPYFENVGDVEARYPIWSRCITQDYPSQGLRLPYQEYLRAGLSTGDILCRVPRSAMLPFSYVGEHVSDDVAVAILERIIQSVERVKEDGHVLANWDRHLEWLNDVLSEVWAGRGPFPGIGSVLQYLGFAKGTAYQRAVLAPMAKKGVNPWDHTLAILEGRTEPDGGTYKKGVLKARERWAVLKSRHALLAKLARFELSPDQVHRIANPDLRTQSGINATESELVENPYIIAETDFGTQNSERIALETIDHGMRPEGDAALFPDDEEVEQDDRRRARAVAHAVLTEAADSGDTVLTFASLIERISERFPDRRACRPDREVVMAEQEFHLERLWLALDEDPKLVALKQLRTFEEHIATLVKRRARKTNADPKKPINWMAALEHNFGKPTTPREGAALGEKEPALVKLFKRRLSVLTGGAGTGKTSLLRVFLKELEKSEGRHPMLLLAPTGKARVRLSTKTGRNAMTIHQFLLRQEWFVPNRFVLKAESAKDPCPATTVVIDECSMIPTDLFGAMLLALDTGPLSRLVLVGDPNQLPPIGPGRPFVDIIEWLKEEHPGCLAPLHVCMRKDEDEGASAEESVALALAEGYRTAGVSPGDDETLAAVARGESHGDLQVMFWEDHDDLLEKLRGCLVSVLGIEPGDYKSFNQSLGAGTNDYARSEAWQILSPTRAQHFGTDGINRLIQFDYKKGLLVKSQQRFSKMPKPFGDYEIVWTDKVIQVQNRGKGGWAWPRGRGLDYVANGEVGLVCDTRKRSNNSDYLTVGFSTQPEVTYRYYRGQVDDYLELAYALTVHKAQGSDFETVFLIIPQSAATLSRELVYTGLTRFRKKLVLLIEKDVQALLRLRNPDCSATRLRNTLMFVLALRPQDVTRPHLEALIHRTRKGIAVRSKSEVVVADTLQSLGISYEYEKPLYSRSESKDFRLPDFTVGFEGDVFYWEHLGMLQVPSYREAWERKRRWYEENGYAERLITSEDGVDGSINAAEIEEIARDRILQE